MTIDERLDRLTERHQALAESLQLLTADVQELRESTKELSISTKELSESTKNLRETAKEHDRNPTRPRRPDRRLSQGCYRARTSHRPCRRPPDLTSAFLFRGCGVLLAGHSVRKNPRKNLIDIFQLPLQIERAFNLRA